MIDRYTRQIPEVLDKYSDNLNLLIDKTCNTLTRYLEQGLKGDDKIVPALFLRNAIEQADGISVMLKNSAIDPIKPLNRILLENMLQLEYIVSDNITERSYAFLVGNIRSDLKNYLKMKKGTKENTLFMSYFEKDYLIKNNPEADESSVEKQIDLFQSILSEDGYKEANAEYDKLKNHHPHWYTLYDGPKSIREMAERQGKIMLYEIFYRTLSQNIHNTAIFNSKVKVDEENKLMYLIHFRNPHESSKVLRDSINFLFLTNMIFLKNLLPKEHIAFSQWYIDSDFRIFFTNLGVKEDYTVLK